MTNIVSSNQPTNHPTNQPTTSDVASLPLISVIVPVYNTGAYLVDAVKSVVAQTYPHIELIIVNDASTDELTLNLLSAYEQVDILTADNVAQVTADIELPSLAVYGVPPKEISAINEALEKRYFMLPDMPTQVRVKVVHAATNQKLGGARNLGTRACTGDYLLYLDSDDLLAPQLIEHVYKTKQGSGADLVFFGNHNFSYDPDCDLSLNSNNAGVPANKLLSREAIISEQKLYDVYYTAWGCFFSRHMIFDYNNFFAAHVLFEDSDWVVRMVLNSKSIYYTPFEGYWRLMHAAQLTAVDYRGARVLFAGDMMQRMAKDIKASSYYDLARKSCMERLFTLFEYGASNLKADTPNKKQVIHELIARLAGALEVLDVPVSSKPSRLYMKWHHIGYKLPWLSAYNRLSHYTAVRLARLYRRYCL